MTMALNNNNNGNCGDHSDAGSSESSGGRLGGGGGGGGGPDGLTLKKGPWTAAEDKILMEYVRSHGEGNWNAVQKNSGLNRCGKSCRLRWANHLRPNLKKGAFSPEEERLILELHAKYGNKWARMAAQLPGRTDNEIKNYWNTRVKRRKRQGLPLYPGDIQLAQPNTPTSPMAPTPPTTPTTPTFQFQNQSHSHLSLSPTAQSFPSCLSPTNQSMTSPNLFDPSSFSFSNHFTFQRPTPLLSTPLRFRRYRESNSFSLPLSTLTSQNSTLLGHSTPTQMPNTGSFQFPMTFNPTLPQTMTTQFETDPIGLAGLIGSVKSELPSSQFSQIQPEMTTDSNLYSSSTQRNIGLLDDLLEEAQAYMHGGDSSMNARTGLGLKEDKPSLDDYSRFGTSSSYLGPSETHIREEANQQQFASTSATEEWSKLLNFIPSSSNMQVTEWYDNNNNNNNSDSGEISNNNGRSIGVTEENLGLEMQRLASSLGPVSASSVKDHGRLSGSWDNMPGFC